jgi:predicted ArsR family transcriptional regulator
LHLDRLAEVGLVHDERQAEHRPGRPARVYRIAAPDPATEADANRRLAQVLAMAVRQQISAREAGRIAGAAEAPATSAADPVDAVVAAMAAPGFSPAVAGSAGDEVDIELHSCPLAAAAREDPATICQLHHGLIEGFADATGDVQVAALHPATTPGACCHVVLRRQR